MNNNNDIMSYNSTNYKFTWTYGKNDDLLILHYNLTPSASDQYNFTFNNFIKTDIHDTIKSFISNNQNEYLYSRMMMKDLRDLLVQIKALLIYKEKNKIDTKSNNEYKIMQWNTEANKVLTEIIPNQLHKIELLLSGKSEQKETNKEKKIINNKYPIIFYSKVDGVMFIQLTKCTHPLFREGLNDWLSIYRYGNRAKLANFIAEIVITDYEKNKDNFISLFENTFVNAFFNDIDNAYKNSLR